MAYYSPRLIKKLEDELKKDPQTKSFCALAQIYYKQGDIQKAKSLCLQGLKRHPFYSQAYVLLAEIHYKEELFSESIQLLNKAKELNPDNSNIYKTLAQIYKKQKQPEQALKAYKMLAFLNPHDLIAISSVQHLEKILRPPLAHPKREWPKKQKSNLSQNENKKSSSSQAQLSNKQTQKLIKLNQILARAESYMKQMERA